MRPSLIALCALAAGLILLMNLRGKSTERPRVQEQQSAITSSLEMVPEVMKVQADQPRAATTLETVERLTSQDRMDALQKLFVSTEGMESADKAALIDAALSLDDPQLINHAETLALEMIREGTESDMLAVLSKVPQFPEGSAVHRIAQEAICRFDGFGLEVIKLKYDRVFPNSRPWARVCGEG